MPFAINGIKNTIFEEPINNITNLASWSEGFPNVTMMDKDEGGTPPSGKDFNGLFYALSMHAFYKQSGNLYRWKNELNYNKNSIVSGSDGRIYRAKEETGPDTSTGSKNPTNPDNKVFWQDVDAVLEAATTVCIDSIQNGIFQIPTQRALQADNATTAAQANKLTNPFTLRFTGGASGSVSILGNANVDCNLTINTIPSNLFVTISNIGIDTYNKQISFTWYGNTAIFYIGHIHTYTNKPAQQYGEWGYDAGYSRYDASFVSGIASPNTTKTFSIGSKFDSASVSASAQFIGIKVT